MKNFFTSMLGALVALVVFTFGGALLLAGVVGAIAALSQKAVTVERGAYLVFDLSTNITDAPPAIDLAAFTHGREETIQLSTVTRALRAAAKDDRIAGVLIKGVLRPAGYGSGYAALKEVRSALAEVKSAGKPVEAYLNFAATRDYYLASVASDLVMDPYGMILMPGLASEPAFFAGAFEKYGVGVQVTRVGKYKSYVESYTRKDMSPEDRTQTQKLLDDIWSGLVADIAQSRSISPAAVQAAVDTEGLIRADAALGAKLVDRVAYRDEVIDELKARTHRSGSKEPFKQITLADYAKVAGEVRNTAAASGETGKRGTIAIVYAEGAIVDGEGDLGEVGGTKFSRELRKLRQDPAIKAIVLRVNSPGGSASASETIQREIRIARKVKPVVVSMGTYAASGGYWISTYGDRIFAEPTTITGSIGVFGLQFDVKRLANDFGVTFDSVKTGKFADAITITRPKTDEELAVLQRLVDWIYDQFVGKVADSRHLKKAAVEEIAQGRVWSGREAQKLGLVDEMGGLNAAIQFAAVKAGLGSNYRVIEYPRKKQLAEALGDLIEKVTPMSAQAHATGIWSQFKQRLEDEFSALGAFNDPQGIYARLPMSLSIR